MDTLMNRLDYAMKKAGKKQIDLVKDLGLPKSSVNQYLSGTSKQMDSGRLYLIADYLGVNPVWLLGFDDTMNDTERAVLEMIRSLDEDDIKKVLAYLEDLKNK